MKTLSKIGMLVCALFVVFTAEAVNYNFATRSVKSQKSTTDNVFGDMTFITAPSNSYQQVSGSSLYMLSSVSSTSSVAPLSLNRDKGVSVGGSSSSASEASISFGVGSLRKGADLSIGGSSCGVVSLTGLSAISKDLDGGNTDLTGGDPDIERLPGQGGSGGNEPWPPVGDGLLALLLMLGGYTLHLYRRNKKEA